MKVKELIKILNQFSNKMKNKEISVIAKNGIFFEPKIKLLLKDKYDCLNKSPENVERLVLYCDD